MKNKISDILPTAEQIKAYEALSYKEKLNLDIKDIFSKHYRKFLDGELETEWFRESIDEIRIIKPHNIFLVLEWIEMQWHTYNNIELTDEEYQEMNMVNGISVNEGRTEEEDIWISIDIAFKEVLFPKG